MSGDQDPGYVDSVATFDRLIEGRKGLTGQLDTLLEGIPVYEDPSEVAYATIRAAAWRDRDNTAFTLSKRTVTTGRLFKRTTSSYELSVQQALDDDTHVVAEYLYLPYRDALYYNQYTIPADTNRLSEQDEADYYQRRFVGIASGELSISNGELNVLEMHLRNSINAKPIMLDVFAFEPSSENATEGSEEA